MRSASLRNGLVATVANLSIARSIRSIAISIQSIISESSLSLDDLELLELEELEELFLELDELEELFLELDDFLLVEEELAVYGLYPPVTRAVPLTRAEALPAT